MRHDFPFKRELLVQQHLLPAARLRLFADVLLPRNDESPVEVVTLATGARMELDWRSAAQRAIAYGVSDESELRLVRRVLGPGDTVLDVGANVGLYTLAMADAVGREGRVHAFEPNPSTLTRLKRNLALNGCDNVVVHAVAVGDRDAVVALRSADPTESGLATVVGDGTELARVPQVTLDDAAADHGFSSVALLKLDVEGAESSVLRGAADLIARGSLPRVLFEALDGSTTTQALLHDAGYRLEVVLPPGPGPLTRPCAVDEQFSYANILATR